MYGSVITITEIRQQADGTRTRDIHTFRAYRWVNVIYAPEAKSSSCNSAAFHRTLTNSVFEDTFVRTKKVDYQLPSSVQTNFSGPTLGSLFRSARADFRKRDRHMEIRSNGER